MGQWNDRSMTEDKYMHEHLSGCLRAIFGGVNWLTPKWQVYIVPLFTGALTFLQGKHGNWSMSISGPYDLRGWLLYRLCSVRVHVRKGLRLICCGIKATRKPVSRTLYGPSQTRKRNEANVGCACFGWSSRPSRMWLTHQRYIVRDEVGDKLLIFT